ncbi:hypothetical protein AQUCO_00100821v1 [Aquilegia coerulea]|uniref:Dynein light chain n=1 Tax=Aquilegia coerulea TaxID=218851 RepID=A0A2G5FC66_AQUCA|nr:hypothetical protein AQUCO_00100821v1 [Aquilegia coerulea]
MDKQRKSALSFFYNSGEGNRTPQVEIITKAKKTASRLWGLRKPKVHEKHQEIEKTVIVKEKEQVKELVDARKSVSHVETNLTSVISFLHVKVLAVDMPGYMQVHAFRSARRAYDSLEKFSSKHMAFNIKKEFDQIYGPAWHCIVGSGFGSYVTYSTGCFLYFSIEKIYILVFKTKVQKALDTHK